MSVLSVICAGVALSPGSVATAPPVAHRVLRHGRAGYHVIQADLSSGRVRARTLAVNGLRSPWRFVSREQPYTAITGTFFHTRTGTPIADVLANGRLTARGNRGSGIGFRPDGTVQIFDAGYRRRVDWNEYLDGVRGAVRLVTRGRVNPNPRAQRFRDPRIWGRAARTGIGVTHSGKLLFVATRNQVTLSEFGRAMVAAGARDAINLDGGGSTCLYHRGTMLIGTQRRLSNMIALDVVPAVAQHRGPQRLASAR
jgi:exopolysaccharide biosynthesis protein